MSLCGFCRPIFQSILAVSCTRTDTMTQIMRSPIWYDPTRTGILPLWADFEVWLFSTSLLLQWVVVLNHRVSMSLLNECFWPNFVLAFIWMKFRFHWPCTPTALPHRLKFSKLIQWMTFSQQVSSYNEWLPSVTEWVWIYSKCAFGLTLSQYLCEWIFHFIALIHWLPSLTNWHFLNEYSALNDRVSMTLLNNCLCLCIYVNEFSFDCLIHQLPSLTDWHFLNEHSALNDRVSMTLLNEYLCLYVNEFPISHTPLAFGHTLYSFL